MKSVHKSNNIFYYQRENQTMINYGSVLFNDLLLKGNSVQFAIEDFNFIEKAFTTSNYNDYSNEIKNAQTLR